MSEYVGKHRGTGRASAGLFYEGKHRHTLSTQITGFCVTCLRRVK